MHEHEFQGQKLRHEHEHGGLPHGYYEHPEDGHRPGVKLPDVTVHLSTGQDGNVFAVVGTVTGAMRRSGHADRVKAFTADVFGSESYGDALGRVARWVNVT